MRDDPGASSGSDARRAVALLRAAAALCLGTGAFLAVQALAWPVVDGLRQARLGGALGTGRSVAIKGIALSPALRISVPGVGVDAVAVAAPAGAVRERALAVAPVAWRPDARGPTCVAAHRDAHFRRLGRVRVGDVVVVTDALGGKSDGSELQVRELVVRERRVVAPEDLRSLDRLGREDLVLVTCWPLDAVGPAPQRLLVVASPAAPAVFASPAVVVSPAAPGVVAATQS